MTVKVAIKGEWMRVILIYDKHKICHEIYDSFYKSHVYRGKT